MAKLVCLGNYYYMVHGTVVHGTVVHGTGELVKVQGKGQTDPHVGLNGREARLWSKCGHHRRQGHCRQGSCVKILWWF